MKTGNRMPMSISPPAVLFSVSNKPCWCHRLHVSSVGTLYACVHQSMLFHVKVITELSRMFHVLSSSNPLQDSQLFKALVLHPPPPHCRLTYLLHKPMREDQLLLSLSLTPSLLLPL